MDSTLLKQYEKAGTIWASTIKFARKQTKEGKSLLELANEIETYIKESGAGVAFPTNLSINEQAAHFTPKWNDTYTLKESDVLKIDIGVHVEGHICDGAITINLNNTHAKQIEANELALENAINATEHNSTPDKIGQAIEDTLKEKGFNPVYNLGGHGLGDYEIHGAPSIPNHGGTSKKKLEECVIAIEPFASNAKGFISEDATVEIFSFIKSSGVRNLQARELLKIIENYKTLPFAERWIRKETTMSDFSFTNALKELMKAGCVHPYAGLKETKGSIVTQVEKSVIVLENKTIVLGE